MGDLTNDSLMIMLGIACAVWSILLVTWVLLADHRGRNASRRFMREELRSLLERTGELRRIERDGKARPAPHG